MIIKHGSTVVRRLALAWCCVILSTSGCGSDDPATPGGNPDPDPPIDAPRAPRLLVSPDQLTVLDVAPEWTDDDRWIVFTAGPGSIVWKILADDRSSLVAVTDPDLDHWILGGYSPCGLENGAIGYFQGLLPGSFGMHIMTADPATDHGNPAPEVLRTFSGVAVGLGENQISSPHELSFDAWGRRGIGTWQSTWFMHWLDRESDTVLLTRPATGLEDATGFRISRDGDHVAYRGTEGMVWWTPFNAEEAHPLGMGSHPSFNGAGTAIGYIAPNGHDYVLHPRDGGTPMTFSGEDRLVLLRATLSWGGDRVAFLVKSNVGFSVYTARLQP